MQAPIEAGPAPTPLRDVDLTVDDVIASARRHGGTAIIGALLAGVLTAGILLVSVPLKYQATATVVVSPLTVSSALSPNEQTMLTFQRLLEGDSVVAETRERLLRGGVIVGEDRLRVGAQLSSTIFLSRRVDTESLAPLLELRVRWSSAEPAATIANTWAEVFIERAGQVILEPTREASAFVEREYAEVARTLEEAESGWLEITSSYREQRDGLAGRTDRDIAAAEKQSAELIAEFKAETRARMEALLEGARAHFPSVVGEDPRAERYRGLFLRLVTIRSQLAQNLPILVLEKAISNDALWQALMIDQAWGNVRLGELTERSLLTEESNPIHTELTLEAVELEAELRALSDELGLADSDLLSSLAAEQGRRSAGLARLRTERSLAVSELRRRQLAVLDAVDRERIIKLGQLDRRVNQLKELEGLFSKGRNEAVLASLGEEQQQVRLALPATVPDRGEPRKVAIKAVIAAILGGCLGLLASVFYRASGGRAERERQAVLV